MNFNKLQQETEFLKLWSMESYFLFTLNCGRLEYMALRLKRYFNKKFIELNNIISLQVQTVTLYAVEDAPISLVLHALQCQILSLTSKTFQHQLPLVQIQ